MSEMKNNAGYNGIDFDLRAKQILGSEPILAAKDVEVQFVIFHNIFVIGCVFRNSAIFSFIIITSIFNSHPLAGNNHITNAREEIHFLLSRRFINKETVWHFKVFNACCLI